MAYTYKVVPAPTKGLKARGVKTNADRFANALEAIMNDMATEGWEYQRTDTLPCEEREGLMSKTTVFQNMLVFRRPVSEAEAEAPIEDPKRLPAPEPETSADQDNVDNAEQESESQRDADIEVPKSAETETARVAAE